MPIALDPVALLCVPVVLERLEGTVSRPEVEVSAEPPAEARDKMAKSIRPVLGSTVKSRICPSVLPSLDCTALFMRWLSRTVLPDCIALELEELELAPKLLELWLLLDEELGLVDEELGLVDEPAVCASNPAPVSERIPPQSRLVMLRFFIVSLLVSVVCIVGSNAGEAGPALGSRYNSLVLDQCLRRPFLC